MAIKRLKHLDDLRSRPSYPQPHNINYIYASNSALRDYLIMQEHARLKYQSKYNSSKQSKRNKSNTG